MRMALSLFIFTVLSCVSHFVLAADQPTVEIEDGILAGISYKIPRGRTLTAFLGVPYAAPPVYEKRFEAPQKLEPWIGVFNASTLPPSCLQYSDFLFTVLGEEDCLYLNVFTPRLPKDGDKLLDVMIFIHGGGFMFGDGYTDFPDYIMYDNDIVYVTISYRLGILGFMSTGDPLLPGNNGLKDQLAALKWVSQNIAKFGGNPESVTLTGSSAGGASVHYHILSNASNGLFHRAISFSGSALPQWTMPRNNTEKSIHVAAFAGCPTSPVEKLVTCMRQRPAKQIVEQSKNFVSWRYEPIGAFGPTIEPDNPESFLTEHPIRIMKSGRMKSVPLLISLCKEEGLYRAADFVHDDKLKKLDTDWDSVAPHMFMFNYSVSKESEKDVISSAIRKYYFGDEDLSEKIIPQLIQAYGDRAFYNDIVRAMKIHAAESEENVYCYKFSYRGTYSIANLMSKDDTDYGVSHADDISYIVTLDNTADMRKKPSDRAMVEFLGTIVAHFIKHGNVKFDDRNNWDPVSKNMGVKFRCLEILSAEEYRMIDFEDQKTMKFWRDLLPLENTE